MLNIDLGAILKSFFDLFKRKPPAAPAPRKIVTPKWSIEMPEQSKKWRGIVWHHSATKDNPGLNDWQAIKKYHTSWRHNGHIITAAEWAKRKKAGRKGLFQKPWSDIGYHGGVEWVENELTWQIGRGWQRSGAHAGLKGNNNFNTGYLGFCCVGDFDKAAPGKETWDLCLKITREVMKRFGIKKENVIGHREVYKRAGVKPKKSCPGKKWDMRAFREEL